MSTFDYDDRREYAIKDQHLDLISEALDAAGLAHDVRNTGGFCMAVVIDCPSGSVIITEDGPGTFLLGEYPEETWLDGEEARQYREGLSTAEVVAHADRAAVGFGYWEAEE